MIHNIHGGKRVNAGRPVLYHVLRSVRLRPDQITNLSKLGRMKFSANVRLAIDEFLRMKKCSSNEIKVKEF